MGPIHHEYFGTPASDELRAISVLWLLLGACAAEPNSIAWQVSFECSADRERAVQVQLGIAPGECEASGMPVYESAVTRENQAASDIPEDLPAGPYAFYARAVDAMGKLVASTCESISLPRKEPVELVLVGDEPCERGSGSNEPRGDGVGEACVDRADCASGLCCTTENCGGGMCTQACAQDADCPAGTLCEHKVCFVGCKTDSECRATWSCEHMNTICEAR